MRLHPKQKQIVLQRKRFNVIRAGRKGGKTVLEVEIMGFNTVSDNGVRGDKVLYIAPTQIQARKIIWEALKKRYGEIAQINEQRLEMTLPTENGEFRTIYVGGWENRENYRGLTGVKHITFDETDSMKDFFIGWQEIFRPLLLDTGGTADFIGTPKKENPNMKRLEADLKSKGEDFASFHFPTWENPFIDSSEIEAARRDMDATTFRQEIEAEYVEDAGALFKYSALLDVFTNTIEKDGNRYLIVDVADDGSDKTVFSYWDGLEEFRRDEYSKLNTEEIIHKIRELAGFYKIPYSHIAIDAIGVGSAVASSSLLEGVVAFKSSFSPIKTDVDIAKLPNLHYRDNAPLTTEYKNLRSQCVFTLSQKVNSHLIASRVTGQFKEKIIEELFTYQDASKGDGKKMAMEKEKVKELIGRSPDHSDTWIMRMYFVIRSKFVEGESEASIRVMELQDNFMRRNANRQSLNSSQ